MAKVLELSEWAPDLTPLGTNVSPLISGVLPRADGYGPFKALRHFTGVLPSACRGLFFARRSDGSIAIFAGTADNLYLLNNTNLTWTLVSKGSLAYGDLVAGDNWRFAQFNDLVIAVQANTVPQKYTLSSGGNFADLAGSPPQASHIAIINRFVVLTGLLSNPRRVHWSDLDGPETWTAGTGLADFQDLPDGGRVHSIVGGDAFGLVFQDEPIRSFVYAPGSPTTFQITKIAENDPIYSQYSAVQAGDRVFYCSAQGFKMVKGGAGSPQAIGKERVDRTFFADVDGANLQLMMAAADPQGTRVFWAYRSGQGLASLFDKLLCYDWSIGEKGRWSVVPTIGEFLSSLAKPGVTLEQLDAIAPTPLPITGAANNGSGLVRLALAGGLFNADFNIVGQNFIVVQGVVGTTEANGTWQFTVVDATHIDLIGSTFTNAWVSGGEIGGSLDALPFSLDSVSISAIAALAAVSSDHAAGFFDGANIEAIMETPEQDLEGSCVFIDGARPMTDAGAALVSLAGRLTQIATSSYTVESAIGATGICPQLLETRYARARVRVPAGAEWSYCRGVAPDAQLAGDS